MVRITLILGIVTALIAYCIDVWESVLFDWKEGYCSSTGSGRVSLMEGNWTLDKKFCCWDIKRIPVNRSE